MIDKNDHDHSLKESFNTALTPRVQTRGRNMGSFFSTQPIATFSSDKNFKLQKKEKNDNKWKNFHTLGAFSNISN